MQLTRKHVVDVLRRTGYPDLAEEAIHVLPDPVELDQVAQWGLKYGITKGELITSMGGSP